MARYKRTYDGERRTIIKSLKLTPSEAAELDTAIADRGVIWSDFIREAAFRCLGVQTAVAETQSNAELVHAFTAAGHAHSPIGNLLNQIARHLHTAEELGPFAADLREALTRYNDVAAMHKAALLEFGSP